MGDMPSIRMRRAAVKYGCRVMCCLLTTWRVQNRAFGLGESAKTAATAVAPTRSACCDYICVDLCAVNLFLISGASLLWMDPIRNPCKMPIFEFYRMLTHNLCSSYVR